MTPNDRGSTDAPPEKKPCGPRRRRGRAPDRRERITVRLDRATVDRLDGLPEFDTRSGAIRAAIGRFLSSGRARCPACGGPMRGITTTGPDTHEIVPCGHPAGALTVRPPVIVEEVRG